MSCGEESEIDLQCCEEIFLVAPSFFYRYYFKFQLYLSLGSLKSCYDEVCVLGYDIHRSRVVADTFIVDTFADPYFYFFKCFQCH